jgi:hypothetical protein
MKTIKEFVEYYKEEFNGGDLNKNNYEECLNYLQGFIDNLFLNKEHSEEYNRLERCVEVLRGSRNFLEILFREIE